MFKFIHESTYDSDMYPRKIEISINAEHVNLDELVQTFNSFVKACGYYPPSDILEYYQPDDAPVSDEFRCGTDEEVSPETEVQTEFNFSENDQPTDQPNTTS